MISAVAGGHKLFREQGFFLEKVDVLCLSCLSGRLGRNQEDIVTSVIKEGSTDWFGPAIPSPNGSLCGTTNAPMDAYLWWLCLKNHNTVGDWDHTQFLFRELHALVSWYHRPYPLPHRTPDVEVFISRIHAKIA